MLFPNQIFPILLYWDYYNIVVVVILWRKKMIIILHWKNHSHGKTALRKLSFLWVGKIGKTDRDNPTKARWFTGGFLSVVQNDLGMYLNISMTIVLKSIGLFGMLISVYAYLFLTLPKPKRRTPGHRAIRKFRQSRTVTRTIINRKRKDTRNRQSKHGNYRRYSGTFKCKK